ncbi:HD-GYP domain-containing protein [Clostridium sp. HV4-5-A1G]|uniref:HD-GYP domain-containing protein n=1 Tax=Clostridium sp. HV4-5-A1G TaxID=2004595 RepID=UPI001238C034|nr:HD-GYP domain-containing protein [Clostridium sp. HV4-5-A1G]KAA8674304.1 HD-GYP domain-containing protein [Clostridium sp. HV4-5-A1G]
MTWEKKLLSLDELKPGMMSSSDVIFEGKMLLAKNIIITASTINNLKQNYLVDKVEVYVKNDSDSPLIVETNTIQKIENDFNEFSLNLKRIFNNISELKVPEMNEIRSFSKKIQEEFKSTGIVIRNIVFYGSGKDAIYRHSINVSAISFILGKWLNLNQRDLNLLTYSAILHDFGKTKINRDILNKNGVLTSREYKIIKTHPVIGYNFIKSIPYLDPSVSYGVLMHHEKMDGSGYPLGIAGDKIHLFAKIIAIADLFDEVNSSRYYKKVRGPFEALKIIQEQSLGKLDCRYCDVFLNHIINYFMGENVLLNNGKKYKVIQVHVNDLTNPLLLDEGNFLDLKKESDLYVEKLVI